MALVLPHQRTLTAGDVIRLMRRGHNTNTIANWYRLPESVAWNLLARADNATTAVDTAVDS